MDMLEKMKLLLLLLTPLILPILLVRWLWLYICAQIDIYYLV